MFIDKNDPFSYAANDVCVGYKFIIKMLNILIWHPNLLVQFVSRLLTVGDKILLTEM